MRVRYYIGDRLGISCRGKEYTYYNVPESIYRLILLYERKNCIGKAFKRLKHFSNRDKAKQEQLLLGV